jgi:2-hydroxy-6-oxonona-2,4-dienedioate hydrolase
MIDSFPYRYVPAVDKARPCIILLPGLFAGSFIWSYCESALIKKGYGTLVFEKALGELPRDKASISEVVSEVIEITEVEGITKAAVIGNSIGALVALELAVANPSIFKLALMSGCPGIGTEATYDLGIKKQRSITQDHAHEVAQMLFCDLSNVPETAILDSYRVVTERKNASSIIRFIQAARRVDVVDQLTKLGKRSLLLWGDSDAITPLNGNESALASLCTSQLVMFKGCGHCPMIEQPEMFLEETISFLEREGPYALGT